MTLKKLELMTNAKDNKGDILESIKFSGNKINIVTSDDNQQGKTTRRKMILYSLGVPTKFSKPMVMKKYKVVTTWDWEGKTIVFSKSYKAAKEYLEIFEDDKNNILSNDHINYKGFLREKSDFSDFSVIFYQIFGVTFYNFTAIVKSFYVDQDQGYWNSSLEGKITENLKFSMLDFISILCDDEEMIRDFERLKEEQQRLVESNKTLKYIKAINEIPEGIKYDDKIIDSYKKDIHKYSRENQLLKWELMEINKYKRDKDKTLKNIEEMNLTLIINGKDIPFKKELVKQNPIQEGFINAKLKNIELEINKNNLEIEAAQNKINNILVNQDIETYEYHQKLSNRIKSQIQITDQEVSFLESDGKRIRREIEKIKETISNYTGGLMKNMKIDTEKALIDFGSKNTKFSFLDSYRHNGPKSGVESIFLTIAILYALNNAVQEKLGLKMPIIIDAPQQHEMFTTNTSRKFASILIKLFKKEQVILFSNTINKTFDEIKFKNYNIKNIKIIKNV